MNFQELNQKILPLDEAAMARCKARWDNIAKPVGSLGVLETLLTKVAGLTGSETLSFSPRAVLVSCADNGITAKGVASTPPEITATMSSFIANGRSSVCLMAKAANAEVFAYDLGIFQPQPNEKKLIDRRVMNGTRDMTEGPAMTHEEATEAIFTGIDLVREKKAEGYRLLATGEMGIGNTSSTSAITAAFLGLDPKDTTGRGVGLSDEGYQNKIDMVRKALTVNQPNPNDALDVLAKVGGLDIACMAGIFIGGALHRVPILVDGVISAAAALTAARLCPSSVICMLPSHVSAEPSGIRLLNAIGLTPLIHADMRLGEGTGAALMLPILDQAVAVYTQLMTFADIGM